MVVGRDRTCGLRRFDGAEAALTPGGVCAWRMVLHSSATAERLWRARQRASRWGGHRSVLAALNF